MPKKFVFGMTRVKESEISDAVMDPTRKKVLKDTRLTKQSYERVIAWLAGEMVNDDAKIRALKAQNKRLKLVRHDIELRTKIYYHIEDTKTPRQYFASIQFNHAQSLIIRNIDKILRLEKHKKKLMCRRKRVRKLHTVIPNNIQPEKQMWLDSASCMACRVGLGFPLKKLLPSVIHIEGILDLIGEFHQVPIKVPDVRCGRWNRFADENLVALTYRHLYHMCEICRAVWEIDSRNRVEILHVAKVLRERNVLENKS